MQLTKALGEIQETEARLAETVEMFTEAVWDVACPTKGLCAKISLSKGKKKTYVEWYPILKRWGLVGVNEVIWHPQKKLITIFPEWG